MAGNRRQRGFTLLETLVALALTTLLMVALAGSSMAFMQSSREGEVLARLQREIVFAAEAIESQMRTAVGITGTYGDWQIVLLEHDGTDFVGKTVPLTFNASTKTLTLGGRVLSRNITDYRMYQVAGQPGMRQVEMETIDRLPMVKEGNLPLAVRFDFQMRNYGSPLLPGYEDPTDDPGVPLTMSAVDITFSKKSNEFAATWSWTTSVACDCVFEYWNSAGLNTTSVVTQGMTHAVSLSKLSYSTKQGNVTTPITHYWKITATRLSGTESLERSGDFVQSP